MDRLLMRMGRLGRLNLLFDRSSSGPGPTLTTDYGIGGPVADVLQRLSGPIPIFLWKSLDPFLLFRANRPFLNTRKHAVAWRDIQALRATAAQNGEYLWPEDWWNLSRLTQAQLDFLSTEFPDA
ncbi:MAG: hypothetical protein FJX77_06205, partial [Armatimonadetes bacterium]|nr:hypothetical protein [Armatimonadota bacterium]